MDRQKRRTSPRAFNRFQIAGALVLAALLIVAAAAVFYHGLISYPASDSQSLEALGSYFSGVIGSMLALASTLLIYVAFIAQRIQFDLQQEQLQLTSAQIANQQFESTFMALVGLHHEISRSLEFVETEGDMLTPKRGRVAFRYFVRLLEEEYRKRAEGRRDTNGVFATEAFGALYEAHQQELGHYFRNLYQIVKFIDANHHVDRNRYADILRAQLSSNESLLLFYNCHHPKGSKRFKPFVTEYALLESLPIKKLLAPEHIELFDTNAYGKRVRSALEAGHTAERVVSRSGESPS